MQKLLSLLILSFFSTQGFAAACPDGSEPVRTISADGSYFIYKCGNTNNNKKSSNTNEDTIVAKKNTPPKDICSETVVTRITTEEYLSESKSFIELKKSVIDVALQNAFQQVNGSEIRNFESLNMSDDNGNQDVNFNSSTYSKYEGLIDSYEVLEQEILDLGSDVKVLSIVIDATVCVKDKNELSKDVLLVGGFTYQNSSFPALKSITESIFSKESKSFELGYGSPSSSYHDILITGKIDNVTSESVVDNRESDSQSIQRSDEEAEMGAFIALFGAIKNNKDKPDDVFDSFLETVTDLKKAEINGSKSPFSIVKIYVSISANHKTDNRTYTSTAEIEKEVSSSSYDLESLAIDAVKQASKDLFLKLNNRNK